MNDKQFLRLAVNQAKKSVDKGGFQAGAVIVSDGQVTAEGISIGSTLLDPTSHAEIACIREACKKLQTTYLRGATIYASLQSCVMCFSAAYWAGISRIVFGCKKNLEMVSKEFYEGTTNTETLNKENNRQIALVYISDFDQEISEQIRDWEKQLQ